MQNTETPRRRDLVEIGAPLSRQIFPQINFQQRVSYMRAIPHSKKPDGV
jgi:hypothetical protein